MSSDRISRRFFLMSGTAAIARPATLGYKSPNEKLNIAAIGVGGKGASDIAGCSSENIVAFADPDWKRAARTFDKYPKAARYKNFRRMLTITMPWRQSPAWSGV
jgi:hypothetical protein